MQWRIEPVRALRGAISVPGDKSISHRLAMLAALSSGTSQLEGYLLSDDCLHALEAVAALGAGVQQHGTSVTIRGTGGNFSSPATPLEMGNSGTLTRLLAGLLAGCGIEARLVGDASLQSRPMQRITAPLGAMGAAVTSEQDNGCAPLLIRPARLRGIDYQLPVASAQVKSALLLAGLHAAGRTRIIEPLPSRDHTERLFMALGLPLRREGNVIELAGSSGAALQLAGRNWSVPGDPSSAAFWLVAAATLPGSEVTVERISLNPTRAGFLDILRRMGAEVTVSGLREQAWEPQADVTVRGSRLHGIEIGGDVIPNIIDELPILAVAAAAAGGTTRIRDAAELRVKESDRIATTAAMLRACGVAVTTHADGLEIVGGPLHGGGVIDSAGDHRIAMAGAILGLRAGAGVVVTGAECAAASYPGFIEVLRQPFTIV